MTEPRARGDVRMPDLRARSDWFRPSLRRPLRSRVAWGGYRSADGQRVYFISSEPCASQGWRVAPRRYTIRVLDWGSGDVETVGTFQHYGSRMGAYAGVRRLAAA